MLIDVVTLIVLEMCVGCWGRNTLIGRNPFCNESRNQTRAIFCKQQFIGKQKTLLGGCFQKSHSNAH